MVNNQVNFIKPDGAKIMNKIELNEYLKKHNIPEKYYCLNGGMEEEKVCLDNVHGKWIVYSVQRGKMWSIKEFDDEEKACKYIFDEINFLLELMKKKGFS